MDKIAIAETELSVLEYKSQRVVTLNMIDRVHRRPDGTARRNFNANRPHFEPGNDFIELDQPDEIRTFGFARPQGGFPERVILITESGYLLLVKSFTDNLAWKVQRELVRSYFRARGLDRSTLPAPPPGVPNFEDPIAAAEAWIEQAKGRRTAELALAAESQAKAELVAKVEVLAPKAEVHDQITEAQGDRTIAEVAKILGTGQNRLYVRLREMKILQSNNLPYQHYLNSDYFRVCAGRIQKGGKWQAYSTTVVTGKGLTYLAKRLATESVAAGVDKSSELAAADKPLY